jgi:preprotein translocase subunit Sss1
MESRARVTSLFVRGDQSIRIECSSNGLSVASHEPGHERRVFRFADTPTAEEFLKLFEQHLAGDGWVLQAFVERRATGSGGPPPAFGERRRRT